VTDYRVRIKGLDDSITRLQGLLGKASTTTELVQIESTLTDRETEREQLLAQQQALKDQVTYATLAIVVHEPSLARSAPPSTFLSGLLAGWETLVAVGAGLLVGLGVVLPWAIALGALAVVGLLVARLVRRVRRRAATPA
jgi:VIT1/CCC1 family predicted Fe2+/Mn2+ transporter